MEIANARRLSVDEIRELSFSRTEVCSLGLDSIPTVQILHRIIN